MPAICQFMLTSTADKTNPDVALEACEFWLTFASLDEDVCNPAMLEIVELLLPHLVPILLRGMVYLPDQQEELVYRNFAEHQAASSSEAISHKPVFHKVKAKGQKAENHDDNDDDDDEDDDFDDDEGNSWTLRKCSAASLDCLSNLYGGEEILPALLPGLQEGFSSADPWVQEASILALGAIAEGCGEAMGTQHMSQLYPYLMELLQSPEGPGTLPQVKCIAAWTMGRYSSWAVNQVQSGAQHDLLARITETLLVRMGDKNQKTQVSCCSALGVMIEHAGDLMIPYLEPTLQALTNALKRYDGRALLNLFDVFGIMADSVGPAIGEGRLTEIYIPSLLQMWDFLANQDPSDRRIIPLLECLASITMNCGNNYQPYALETFDNAMAMIESISLDLSTTGESIDNDEDADPIVCAADILDGLVEGLGSNFSNLVASSSRYGGVFSNVLLGLTQHEVPGVRMSAFAIVGDLARRAHTVLEAGLHEFLTASTLNLDTVHPSVCNNAVWAIGEICVRCQGNSAPLVPIAPTLVQHLIGLLMGNGVSAGGVGIIGLPENAATTMGRLAKVDPSFVASDLPRFLTGWCDAMARIRDVGERRDAFQGFINAVYANPSAISVASQNQPLDSISSVLFAVVSWHMPEDLQGIGISSVQFLPFPSAEAELGESLGKLLQDIKQSLGEDTWRNVETNVPVNVRQLLRMVYHV
jgi:transportin-1